MGVKVAFILIAASLVGAAWALPPALTQDETRAELLGYEVTGLEASSGMRWRECIDPAGDTLYSTPNRSDPGRLEVKEDGAACFRYASTGYAEESCFAVHKEGEQLQLHGPNALVFIVAERRRVSHCTPPDRPGV